MKSMKRILAGCAVILALSVTTVTAFAATYETPADAVAGVTGMTGEEVSAARQSGKSYGAIAAEAGKLEEYQQAVLELRKEVLSARVAEGRLTQAQADAAITAMEEHQTICDGTGTGCDVGNFCGTGNGTGAGTGYGHGGHGTGSGHGGGGHSGRGLRDGSCLYR